MGQAMWGPDSAVHMAFFMDTRCNWDFRVVSAYSFFRLVRGFFRWQTVSPKGHEVCQRSLHATRKSLLLQGARCRHNAGGHPTKRVNGTHHQPFLGVGMARA